MEGLEEDVFLRSNGADEMVALAEEAESAALEVEAGRHGIEEKLGTLQMGLGLPNVV